VAFVTFAEMHDTFSVLLAFKGGHNQGLPSRRGRGCAAGVAFVTSAEMHNTICVACLLSKVAIIEASYQDAAENVRQEWHV
jgi:hypothetical protein